MTPGYQLDHSLSLRLLKPFFDDVLIEHGGVPHVVVANKIAVTSPKFRALDFHFIQFWAGLGFE